MNTAQKYTDAWEAFNARNDEETTQALGNLRFTNIIRGGAPLIKSVIDEFHHTIPVLILGYLRGQR